jgi:uncharacterized caspase-like protein
MAGRHALIIACDEYDHEGLRSLKSPAHDVEALAAVLADRHIGGFEVTTIMNQPTSALLPRIEAFFANRKRDDLLLLHFSGHGIKDAAGRLHLAAANTDPALLQATSVSARFVSDQMTETRAGRVVILLDCCFGGAFSRGMAVRATGEISIEDSFPGLGPGGRKADDGRGRVVVTASSATEYAFEGDQLASADQRAPSVFTGALVGGLATGAADTGGDGWVDLDELYDYVYERVRTAIAHQTPSIWGTRQGKVVIASVPPAARIRPVAPAAELAGRALGPAPAVRLAAVADLRRLLLGEDIEQAAGALDLLRKLTTDDSRQVSAAAQGALDEAQLKAGPNRIDLGEVRPGQPPHEQEVRLAGPPLAQVFQAVTTARWLRVEQSDPSGGPASSVRATADVSALPDGPGDLTGSISVVNRIGELVIPVTARVTRRPRTSQEIWVPAGTWASSQAALALAAVAIVAGALGAALEQPVDVLGQVAGPSELGASGALGAGYYLIRSGLLLAAIVLAGRPGPWRAAGRGIAAASIVFFLTDAVSGVHNGVTSWAWIEFLAVVTFAALLVVPLWPFAAKPPPLRALSPAGRPLSLVPLAAAGAQFVLLFMSFQAAAPEDGITIPESATIVGMGGTLAALLAVVPVAGLCVFVALTEPTGGSQRAFAVAAVSAYFGPELYLMLGSLISGPNFTYLGDDAWAPGPSSGWFVVLQAAVAAALAVSTLTLLLRSTDLPGQAVPPVRDGDVLLRGD